MTGQTSDQDQDLLRAMLVFACAGLDSAMKTLVRDSLPTLANRDASVQHQLDSFAENHIRDLAGVGARPLAQLLAHPTSPREALIDHFVDELTGGSLQSVDQLHRVRAALGIADDRRTEAAINQLRATFDARNEITHEMDLNPATARRTRRHRSIGEMVSMANGTFDVGFRVVGHVMTATIEA